MISLLDPIQIGEIYLPNRVIMAPLTRLRGTHEHIPTQLMAEYYAQRVGAGLNHPASRSQNRDPVCGMEVDPSKAVATVAFQGATFYFCGHDIGIAIGTGTWACRWPQGCLFQFSVCF